MAHPIELIFSPSEGRSLGRDVCFLCGATLPPEHNTDEHVIPKWVQHRFKLWDQKLALLNKTVIPYRMLTIPCCKECNSVHLARIEDRVQQAVAAGVQAVREVDELTLFVWLGKIFYGLLYREHLLKFDRSSPSSDPIVPAEVVEQFALHHKFLQAARIPFDFIPETPASIFIFETLPPANTQAQFDLLDSLFTLSISIRLGTVGLIASLQDGRAAKLSFDYSEFNKIPLHPAQFSEVTARVFYDASRRIRVPKFLIGEDGSRVQVVQAPLGGLSGGPLFSEGNMTEYAKVLAHCTHFPLEMLHPVPDKVISWLRDSNGKLKRMQPDDPA